MSEESKHYLLLLHPHPATPTTNSFILCPMSSSTFTLYAQNTWRSKEMTAPQSLLEIPNISYPSVMFSNRIEPTIIQSLKVPEEGNNAISLNHLFSEMSSNHQSQIYTYCTNIKGAQCAVFKQVWDYPVWSFFLFSPNALCPLVPLNFTHPQQCHVLK